MIRVAVDRRWIFLVPERVVLLKCAEKELMAVTEDGEHYFGDASLSQILDAFPGVWMRASRHLAVRMSKVVAVRDGHVILDNGDRYPLSRRQRMGLAEECVGMSKASIHGKRRINDGGWDIDF